ncbi:hypothetical protein Ciccas_000093 [Cichlidogyrus casuarinus]|uniref:Maturase K n=1 Tax=Cichlidogyrus casuarinus TaxID=1844966 RepID=A0ABD2QP43_9PLAT
MSDSKGLGASQGGIFCALVFIINQLIHDGIVDVYYISKLLTIQRPGIWRSCVSLQQSIHILFEILLKKLKKKQVIYLGNSLPEITLNLIDYLTYSFLND